MENFFQRSPLTWRSCTFHNFPPQTLNIPKGGDRSRKYDEDIHVNCYFENLEKELSKMKNVFRNSSVILVLIFLESLLAVPNRSTTSLHFLEPGDSVNSEMPGLSIFCHNAKPKYIIYMWKNLNMNLHTNSEKYDIYHGKTQLEVKEKHEVNQRSWTFNLFGTKKSKQFKINPFEDTCIGIFTYNYNEKSYTLSMTQERVDVTKVLMMALGIIIFWYAQKLSQNPLFYYLCGITLGVTTSVIILIYFASKLFPRGKAMYLMVATGWTMSFYLAQALWENAQLIAIQYREYVLWYILITSMISFILCYRFGPVTNPRTKKIIQWFLQFSGLMAIYYSSYFWEASASCCVLLLLLYNFPIVMIHRGKKYWKTMFPDQRKLLTENEYRLEGLRETKKALDNLQTYCSSPECNPWKTVLRLKDPIRFAKFMEGDSHISDDELDSHEAEITRIIEECEYTDDDEDDDY
ncbi:nuclear envelope integral membrane protein 1 [Cephus cinctus]|uniref:Nuclear envelope integral membrane protein 1 n=1 Tax=Cephus cinctus TaxID=211228 RepID=A0AAJ7CAH3_CEPCN|nr:nuclear envelope integral membrane protein 1 [Cephus cinctus]